MKCRTSKASLGHRLVVLVVADHPRQASEESTSVGGKCFRAKVLLPEPLGPMRMTRERLGILIVMGNPIHRQTKRCWKATGRDHT